MEWQKINKNRIPNSEVLSANFQPGTYGYREKLIGYLSIKDDCIICENENESLENCSHYIDLQKFDL